MYTKNIQTGQIPQTLNILQQVFINNLYLVEGYNRKLIKIRQEWTGFLYNNEVIKSTQNEKCIIEVKKRKDFQKRL